MIISSKKYACETCIKGHRSSLCKHTDRPLFEIKKKGRPVTQCEHCRELRKTKQVHVKCICESKGESSHQGSKQGFEGAAFPDGLPQALEASVAFQSLGEGTSSDSDHGGVHHGHHCKSGDPCNCVMPRIRNQTRGGPHEQQQQNVARSGSAHDNSQMQSRTSSQILARIAELRPVLPRPTQGGPIHNPSSGLPHGHSGNRHHDAKPYQQNPYGMPHHSVVQPASYPSLGSSNAVFSYNEQPSYGNQMQMMDASWGPPRGENLGFDPSGFPSPCNCGDDCRCPGCIHHNRATSIPSSSAYASCNNPENCSTCLDCTIMSLPSSAILPPDTALSIYDAQMQNDAIDDWLRQMSASISTDMSSTQQMQQGFGNSFHQTSGWSDRGGYSFPDMGQSMPSSNLNYDGFGTPPPSGRNLNHSNLHTGHRSMSSISGEIDPRLLSSSGVINQQFLGFSNQHRSRSPSTSSQSSYQGSDSQGTVSHPPYRPSGRMQGVFTTQGVRSAPHLDIRPNMQRGPSSGSSAASISPSPGSSSASPGARGPYSSNGQDHRSSEYDPSLANLQIY